MNKGLDVTLTAVDADHIRATLRWRERELGDEVAVTVVVRNPANRAKTNAELDSDARALAARLARAFADMLES
jgi:hypothetical protein